jgi:DNA topoisomerase-3
MILGREIPKEQAQKLLTTGKTGLLEGFISKRGRPFSAYLKLDDGKVGFEFPKKTRPQRKQNNQVFDAICPVILSLAAQ